MYRALVRRDPAYGGVFVAAIRTTGIFCRPGCGARQPREENVEFYPTPRDALVAGYRPCKRCAPLDPPGATPPWLQTVLEAVDADPQRRWTDGDLRARGVDPARARRWFQAQHGMTFHAYVRARRLGHALGRLRRGDDLSRTAFDHGYESLSGFRDGFAKLFGRPPGKAARVRRLAVTRIVTPMGPMVAGATDDGVCLLEFADRRGLERQIVRLQQHLPNAAVPGDHEHLAQLDRELAEYFAGTRRAFDVPVVSPGTPFQERCWAYMASIPYGETRSYDQEARAIGRPGAHRAVGRANGDNRIAIVIPCHRVVRADGQLAGYGGGKWRKQALLELERSASGEE